MDFNCTATDNLNIQSASFDINGSLNKTISFSFIQSASVSLSYVIYNSLETLRVGFYSIMNVTLTDTNNNKLVNTTSFNWEVTSTPSSGGGTPSSGGGSGSSPAPLTIIIGNGT